MSKKVEFSKLKGLLIVTGILSVMLPWYVIAIPKNLYIFYFFFGLYSVVSKNSNIIYTEHYLRNGFEDVHYDLASLTYSNLLLIPGFIYILSLIFSLSNLKVDGEYKHKNLAIIGFILMLCSHLVYFLILSYMVANFVFPSGLGLSAVRIIPSFGAYLAATSTLFALLELIFCISDRNKLMQSFFTQEREKVRCYNCNYLNPIKNNFCTQCGYNLEIKARMIVRVFNLIVNFLFFIGGILLISTIFLPTAHSSETNGDNYRHYIIGWIIHYIEGIGMYSSRGYFYFIDYLGIVIGCVIVFCGICVIYYANEIKNSEKSLEQYWIILLLCGILPFLMVILFLFKYQNYDLVPSYGVFVALIGCFLIFIGVILSKLKLLIDKKKQK